jgi:hypothetical protein
LLAELSFEIPPVLARVIVGPIDNRPLTANCRFDPTVQNHPPDVTCRVFRSGPRPIDPQQGE